MEEVKKRRGMSADVEMEGKKLAEAEAWQVNPADSAEGAEAADTEMKRMTIEETFAALDALIDQLESGKGSLEYAFKNYEEGMKLVKSCNEKIEKIEKQILVLSGKGTMEDMDDGQYVSREF